jgi:hypothetical protein
LTAKRKSIPDGYYTTTVSKFSLTAGAYVRDFDTLEEAEQELAEPSYSGEFVILPIYEKDN